MSSYDNPNRGNLFDYSLNLRYDKESNYVATRGNISQQNLEKTTNVNANWFADANASVDSLYKKEKTGSSLFTKLFTPKVENSALKNTTDLNVSKNSNPMLPDGKRKIIFAGIASALAIIAIIGITLFLLVFYGVLNKGATYSESCSTSNACILNKGLVCNGTCVCESSKTWNGSMCITLFTFGSSCTGSNQCETGLTCLNSICQCASSSYYSVGQCLSKLSYGSTCAACNYTTCSTCNACSQCQDYSNGYCEPVGLKCSCSSVSYYDSTVKLCLLPASYNEQCLSLQHCTMKSGISHFIFKICLINNS
jgi:hypothetical protein